MRKPKYLEDIVNEDSTSLSRFQRIREHMRHGFNIFPVRHPIITSVGAFELTEYMRTSTDILSKLPMSNGQVSAQASLLGAYEVYLVIDSIKQYVVEHRSRKIIARDHWYKRFYNWFLANSKVPEVAATVISAVVSYHAAINYNQPVTQSLNIAISHGFQVGLFTELAAKSLRNLQRIKKSVARYKEKKKINKKTLLQRIEDNYNSFLCHPFVLTGLLFPYYFSGNYQNGIDARKVSGNLIQDMVNNPDQMFSMAARTGFENALTLGSLFIASSVLHSYSLKEFGLRTAKTFYSIAGKRRKAIGLQQKIVDLPNSTERRIEDIVELGNLCYKDGEKVEAFSHYRRALRLFYKKSDEISYTDFFRRIVRIDYLRKQIKRFFYTKGEEKAINRAFIALLNKDQRALEYIKKEVEKDPDNPELRYLYGKAFEILGMKESGSRQKRIAIELKERSGISVKETEGVKNNVLTFEDPMLGLEVIAKSGPNIREEIATTKRLRELIADYENYDTPIPIGIMEIRGRECYVMEFAQGEILKKRIEDGEATLEELCDVADYMGLIHARLKPAGLKPRQYIDNITDRLTSSGISQELVWTVRTNLAPIFKSLEDIVWVYNKDSHTRNWYIDGGVVIALDMETEDTVPITVEAANLLGQDRKGTYEEKREVLERYISAFRRYSDKKILIDREKYELAYLNSLVLRAFEVYSQVKGKHQDIKDAVIENAQEAIDRIRREHRKFFFLYSGQYTKLDDALTELKFAA